MTTRGRRFTVGQIVTAAYRKAGLIGEYQAPSSEQGSVARMELDRIVARLTTEGYFATTVEMYETTLITAVSVYDLPDYALNVVGKGMWIPAGSTDPASVEIPVQPTSRETWQEIAAKSASGPPKQFWCERAAESIRVRLWPVPSAGENASAIRWQLHTAQPNVSNADADLPFENYWADWLVYSLGHELAVNGSMPLERCAFLDAQASKRFEKCKGAANQNTNIQLGLGYSTRWSR